MTRTPTAAVVRRSTFVELTSAPVIPWGGHSPRAPRTLLITRHHNGSTLRRVTVQADSHTDAPGITWDSEPSNGWGRPPLTDLPEYLRTVVASFEPDLLPWTEYPTREVTHA